MSGRFSTPNLRAAWWALRARWVVARRLRRRGLDGALRMPEPPDLPPAAERGVRAVLRRTEDTCLVESIVLQRWYAAHGVRRDLVVGITGPTEEFRAHAWLEGDSRAGDGEFHELLRRPAP